MSLDILNKLPVGSGEYGERKIIVFTVDKIICGIDIMGVREIVNPTSYSVLPNSPDYVIGVSDHREEVVPIINMRRRLSVQSQCSEKEKWVIVNVLGRNIALQVDAVQGVVSVQRDQERERHPLSESGDISWVKKVYSEGKALLFELDLVAMLNNTDVTPGNSGQGVDGDFV